MAITINWATLVINIPKADTQLVQSSPTEIRSLDLDTFRLTLKDLEDDEDGIIFLDTHNHTAPLEVSGVTLARVIEIINGYTITFEDDQYAVNLVGANSNVADVTNLNQVSIRSANSAGLTYSKQVEDSAFEDARVWIDTVNGMSGTLYPRGTPSDPVDNLVDAEAIVAARNLPRRLHLRGDLTLLATDDVSEYNIKGAGSKLASLIANTGVTTTNLIVESLSMTGDLNGNISATNAVSFGSLIDFDGKVVSSGLGGTIDLGLGGLADHEFIDCYSEVAGTGTPALDCNSLVDLDVQFRRYSGGLEIINFTSGNISIDLTTGSVTLASSCTGGTILVRGVGILLDNSNGSAVNKEGLLDASRLNIFNIDPSVHIDTSLLTSGSSLDWGTARRPVSNLIDAYIIAVRENLQTFKFKGDLVLDRDASEHSFLGEGNEKENTIDFNGQNVNNCFFFDAQLSGTVIGTIEAVSCEAGGLIDMEGVLRECGLTGDIAVADSGELSTNNCFSQTVGSPTPAIVMGTNTKVNIKHYSGELEIKACTTGSTASVDIDSGHLVVNASCVGGVVDIHGVGLLSDVSLGTDVNKDGFVEALNVNVFNTEHAVYIDTNLPTSGTLLDWGTAVNPVNNIVDAFTIAERENVTTFKFRGDLILDRNYSEFTFRGLGSEADNTIDFNGQTINRAFFENTNISGTLNGKIECVECELEAIIGFNGVLRSCGFKNGLQLIDGADVVADNCYSHVPGMNTPTIDVGTNVNLNLRHYSGGVKIENFTTGCVGTVDLDSGHAIIDDTSTGGELVVRGVGHLTESVGHGVTITKSGLVEGLDTRLSRQILANKMVTDPDTGILTIFDDDGSILLTAEIFEDAQGIQHYRGSGAERRDKLS